MTFPNLEPGCSFTTQILSYCNGVQSEYNQGESFTIPEECPPVSQVEVIETTVCSATLAFEGVDNGMYLIQLFQEGNPSPIDVQEIQYSIVCYDNLLPSTSYSFRVLRDCDCERSGPSDLITFETARCDRPAEPIVRFDECGYEYFIPQGLIMKRITGGSPPTRVGPYSQDRWNSVSGTSIVQVEFTLIRICNGKNCSVESRSNTITGITPQIQHNDCVAPIGLEYNIDQLLFNVINPPENATGYECQFRITNASPFEPLEISTNGSIINPNISGSCYLEIRLRTVCACTEPPSVSDWENYIFEPEVF